MYFIKIYSSHQLIKTNKTSLQLPVGFVIVKQMRLRIKERNLICLASRNLQSSSNLFYSVISVMLINVFSSKLKYRQTTTYLAKLFDNIIINVVVLSISDFSISAKTRQCYYTI
jgi:hypothetical protein